MTTTLAPEAERMIEVYTEWLNKHHEDNEDDYRITRGDYDLVLGDEPKVLLDWAEREDRIIRLYANAYHDEGGPCYLTGFFSFDDGIRYGDNQVNEDPKWILDAMVQEFDTLHALIWTDGAYNPDSLPQERG
jgi:hypothetical protein